MVQRGCHGRYVYVPDTKGKDIQKGAARGELPTVEKQAQQGLRGAGKKKKLEFYPPHGRQSPAKEKSGEGIVREEGLKRSEEHDHAQMFGTKNLGRKRGGDLEIEGGGRGVGFVDTSRGGGQTRGKEKWAQR